MDKNFDPSTSEIEVITVGQARQITGVGTQVIIRPHPHSQVNPKDPDADVAYLLRRPE